MGETIGPAAQPPPLLVISRRRGFAGLGLGECWRHRDLLLLFVWRDLAVRYKQTVLGVAWLVLQPLATVLVLSLFLGRLAQMPSAGAPYPLFLLCGLLPWLLVARAISEAGTSLTANERLLSKVWFPRLLLPSAAVLAGLLDLAVMTLLALIAIVAWGPLPGATLLLLPLFLLQAALLALGTGWLLAGLDALFRDVRFTLPFLTQLWFFASPIAYPAQLVPEPWRWVFGLNPLAGLAEGFRWALLGTPMPDPALLCASAASTLSLAVGGLLLFRHAERDLTDDL